MARFRWLTLLVFAWATMLPTPTARAAPDEPIDSPEYTEIAAFVAQLTCPDLSSLQFELTSGPLVPSSYEEDGVRIPQPTGRYECRYQTPLVDLSVNRITITVSVGYPSIGAPGGCSDQPEEQRDNLDLQSVSIGRTSDTYGISLRYTISQAIIEAVPGIEATIADVFTAFGTEFEPIAGVCPYDPPEVVCPTIAGFIQSSIDEPQRVPLMQARCYYYAERTDAVPDSASVEVAVRWATDRSDDFFVARACEDFGESPRPKLAIFNPDGQSAQSEWLYYGLLDHPLFDPATFEAAAIELRTTTAEHTVACPAELITSPWSPLPTYLADVYAPERIDAPPIPGSGLQIGLPADLRRSVVDEASDAADETPVAAPTATDDRPVNSTATGDRTDSAVPGAPSTPGSPAGDGGSSGSGSIVRTVITIGALVLSLLGLALAFMMIRKESRVRPAMDIARIVIVLVVALAMMVVFSRSAPLWAVLSAVLLGAAIGWFQGHNLRIRVVGDRVIASRGAVAIVMFGAGLLISQVAGLLNRTGVIAIGIALSFLSAATSTGLVAGRRPGLIEARKTAAAAVVITLVGGVAAMSLGDIDRATAEGVSATPEPSEQPLERSSTAPDDDIRCGADPDQRCEAQEYLIDLVDWDTTSLTGGLLVDENKPPIAVAVPRAFDSVPDPVTRTVEWTSGIGGDDVAFSVTETFTFGTTDDGECCSVRYDGTGTEIASDGDTNTYVMNGRFEDIQAAGERAVPQAFETAVPFGEAQRFSYEPDDACHRTLATDFDYEEQTAIDVFTVNGTDKNPDRDWTEAQFTTECEIDGFTMEEALARADELAPRDERGSDCPANAELYPALAVGSELTYSSVATVGQVFTYPYEAACTADGQLGSTLPGSMRSEFVIEYAPPETQDFADETTLSLLTRPSAVLDEHRCAVDDQGRAAQMVEGDACLLSTMHQLDDDGSWVSIVTDNNYDDGPNVEVSASLPWGSYHYRCHHCNPWSPEITRFLGQFHDFSVGWIDSIPGADVDGSANDTEPTTTDDSGAPLAADDTESGGTSATDDTGTGDDTGSDDSAAAALVAMFGLLGSAGILATAIAESGHSPAELASTVRSGGVSALNQLLALPENAIIDEHGELIVAGDDGLYAWEGSDGPVRLTRAEIEEEISEGQVAINTRRDELQEIVTEMYSDEAAEQRFADLAANSEAASAEIMAEIRAGWAEVDRLQSVLDQREAALIRMEAAWADQDYAQALSSWDQVTLAAINGMGADVAGLPGEVVDLTRSAVTAVGNPENWQIFAEATAETLYDLAGMAAGNSFGDGAESVGNGVKFGGQMAAGLAHALATDPVGTLAAMTAINDFANAVDPDSTLGQRLGSLGLGLIDVAGTLSGLGFAGAADDLVDIARAAEAAQGAVDTGLDVTRLADAAGDAAGAVRVADATDAVADGVRVADAAGDAGLGIARVSDEALEVALLQTRDEIADAIRAAQAQASQLGVPVEQVLAGNPEVRALFQGSGMHGMAALESAGGLSDEMAGAVVRMHDEITESAVRVGTNNAIDKFADATNVRPSQVLVGNSGSVGPGRSVLTDADRTVVLVFEDSQLDAWRAANPIEHGTDIRLPSRLEAQEALQNQYAQIHQVQVELALNNPRDPAVLLAQQQNISLPEAVAQLQAAGADDPAAAAVRLTREQMDTSTYSGFGSLSGHGDSYPAGFTGSRQSVQGSTDVYRVNPATGEVSRYTTSGQAILDQNELTRLRLDAAGTTDIWHDPTRIPQSEMRPLLQQQVQAVQHYDDVKSITKAVDRVQYIAGRTGQALPDQRLVQAAVAIRANPTSTVDVLAGLQMTEQEFIEASRNMVLAYGGAS